MTLFDAFILGIVQGLTEFFPVSSSTHLTLVKDLLGLSQEENMVFFDLSCHLGTLLATAYVFRKDIFELFTTRKDKFLQLSLALLPLIPAYYLLKPLRQSIHSWQALSLTLLITASLLFLGASLRLKEMASIRWSRRARDALCIGAMQATALIPGISRSASTISCARFLGWEAKEAVRFSFLLGLPTIFGGTCLEMFHLLRHAPLQSLPISLPCCLMGFGTSALGALAVIGPAIRILEKGHLRPFAWYCLALACLLFLLAR